MKLEKFNQFDISFFLWKYPLISFSVWRGSMAWLTGPTNSIKDAASTRHSSTTAPLKTAERTHVEVARWMNVRWIRNLVRNPHSKSQRPKPKSKSKYNPHPKWEASAELEIERKASRLFSLDILPLPRRFALISLPQRELR